MARLGYRCRHHLVEYGLHCSKQNEYHMLIDRMYLTENIDKGNTDPHSAFSVTRTLGSMNRPTALQRCWWSIVKNSFREHKERINWIENGLNIRNAPRNRSC